MIAGLKFRLWNPITTMWAKAGASGVAGARKAVGVVVTGPFITDLTIRDDFIATIRRIAVAGRVTALALAISVGIGCAIVAGFPGLTGAIATTSAWRIGRAADIVEDRRADALVGFAAFGAIRTGQAFPVGWAVRGAFTEE